MKRTNEMGKKSKFMRTQKALAAFFTVVLMVGLFPIGMSAFGEDDEPSDLIGVGSSDLIHGDEQDEPTGSPETADAAIEPAASTSFSNNTVAITEAESNFEHEEEIIDEPIEVDTSKEEIVIQVADPDNLPAPGMMRATIQNNTQIINVNAGEVVANDGLLTFNSGRSGENSHSLTVGAGITLNCDIEVKATGDVRTGLILKGEGAIKGSRTRSVVNVEGSDLVLEGNLRIYNGVGQKTNAQNHSWGNGEYQARTVSDTVEDMGSAGGGINIQRSDSQGLSTFEMKNGIIGTTPALYANGGEGCIANEANFGGGIFIDDGCTFNMYNGIVGYNKAIAHEGGGIFYSGGPDDRGGKFEDGGQEGTIFNAEIVNNRTDTVVDWGGGGIFIRAHHTLKFDGSSRTSINNNTADGLGGGISGCPHADLGLGKVSNGFALYGNTANKKTSSDPKNKFLWFLGSAGGTGDIFAYSLDGEQGSSFKAELAQDYYCIQGSEVYGQQFTRTDSTEIAYKGRIVEHNQATKKENASITKAYDYNLPRGEWLIKENATVGLTAIGVPPADMSYNIRISGNYSKTHGGGIGCNGSISIGTGPDSTVINNSWSFEFNKILKDGLNNQTSILDYVFSFGLYSDKECTNKVATATNDENGVVHFEINDPAYNGSDGSGNDTQSQTYTFWIKEDPLEDGAFIEVDKNVYKVEATIEQTHTTQDNFFDNNKIHYYESNLVPESLVFYNAKGAKLDDTLTIANKLKLQDATWAPEANKSYYGSVTDPAFSFTVQAIENPIVSSGDHVALRELIRKETSVNGVASLVAQSAARISDGAIADDDRLIDDNQNAFSITGVTGPFVGYDSKVLFPEIVYQESGDYWYVMTEDASGGMYVDPGAYVMHVEVIPGSTKPNGPYDTYIAQCISLYYYESLDSLQNEFTVVDDVEDISFVNLDEDLTYSLSSYAVNAVTGVPVASDQRCLVDPKIYKVLEGRAMKDGEFKFSLIQVMGDYTTPDESANTVWPEGSNIPGYVISTATNDQYGMVDFDAANNQAGEGEDPCCLLFTSPGTYHYRVIEVAGSQTDPAIEYSKEVITFTAVIKGGEGEPLVCTEMYYGHLVGRENVPFDESDDPEWHPTMTNTSRPMELRVQKTSAWDRNEGLENATYGLYLASNGQNDVFMGQATSDADGWMTFKGDPVIDEETGEVTGYESLNLTTGNLYYFKEIAAPDEHTVSQFRSAYFYLIPDAASPTGFSVSYSDTRSGDVSLMALDAEDDDGLNEAASDGADKITPGEIEDGTMVYTYDLDGGVFDEVTAVEVNKLQGRTHAWISGARLAVIDKATGNVIDTWTTKMETHRIEKRLNVNTPYILRELEVPAGYYPADDVEFMLDDYGTLIILSGLDYDNAESDGNTTLSMFDFMVDGEMTLMEYREREIVRDDRSKGGDLVQTGDKDLPYALAIGAVAALGIATFALVRMRRQSDKR